MARGFESKDVEFQQAEADRTRNLGPARTPEALDRLRTIELALFNARAELAKAKSARHRDMLEQAVAALEQQLGPRP